MTALHCARKVILETLLGNTVQLHSTDIGVIPSAECLMLS